MSKEDAEKTKKLGEWLVENHIPSLSPNEGIHLLEITRRITELILTVDDEFLKTELIEYVKAMTEVSVVSVIHQNFVLKKFASLIEARRG